MRVFFFDMNLSLKCAERAKTCAKYDNGGGLHLSPNNIRSSSIENYNIDYSISLFLPQANLINSMRCVTGFDFAFEE